MGWQEKLSNHILSKSKSPEMVMNPYIELDQKNSKFKFKAQTISTQPTAEETLLPHP